MNLQDKLEKNDALKKILTPSNVILIAALEVLLIGSFFWN